MDNFLLSLIKLQQEEKVELLKRSYRKRALVENKLIPQLDTDIIKAISGPRRAGKSMFAINCLVASKKSKDFIYINFDNRELLNIDLNTSQLIECLKQFKSKYIFLDEIQNLEGFELLVSTLQRHGYKLVISGSNSNLLSQELSTHLTGRYIQFEVFTFSLRELPHYHVDKANIEGLYPEVAINKLDYKLYLKELFNAIIYKDIVQRYKLRKSEDLMATAEYLISNIGTLQSFQSIAKKINIPSLSSVSKYLNYLNSVYLIFPVRKFSFKSSEILKNPCKYYCIDNGLINTISTSFSKNQGRLLENQVYLELLKASVDEKNIYYFVGRKKQLEIDFLVKKNNEILAIQVCTSLVDEKTRERELRAFKELESEFAGKQIAQKIIITNKEENFVTSEELSDVTHLSLVQFVRFIRDQWLHQPKDPNPSKKGTTLIG
jgi:predicted AAA+ superfamily ATPase